MWAKIQLLKGLFPNKKLKVKNQLVNSVVLPKVKK